MHRCIWSPPDFTQWHDQGGKDWVEGEGGKSKVFTEEEELIIKKHIVDRLELPKSGRGKGPWLLMVWPRTLQCLLRGCWGTHRGGVRQRLDSMIIDLIFIWQSCQKCMYFDELSRMESYFVNIFSNHLKCRFRINNTSVWGVLKSKSGCYQVSVPKREGEHVVNFAFYQIYTKLR